MCDKILLLLFIFLAGSKNVHLILRNRDDIALYADGRFQVARVVAATVLDTLESLRKRPIPPAFFQGILLTMFPYFFFLLSSSTEQNPHSGRECSSTSPAPMRRRVLS